MVAGILEAATSILVADSRLENHGFSSFNLSYRQPWIGRNPKSSAPLQVPGNYVPHFKTGKEMREGMGFP